nr:hypothetical protein [uncultured bacterium]
MAIEPTAPVVVDVDGPAAAAATTEVAKPVLLG